MMQSVTTFLGSKMGAHYASMLAVPNDVTYNDLYQQRHTAVKSVYHWSTTNHTCQFSLYIIWDDGLRNWLNGLQQLIHGVNALLQFVIETIIIPNIDPGLQKQNLQYNKACLPVQPRARSSMKLVGLKPQGSGPDMGPDRPVQQKFTK